MEKLQRLEKEAADQKLEQDLRSADFRAVLAKVEADLKLLMERKAKDGAAELKTAKDMKFLRDRQQTPGTITHQSLLCGLTLSFFDML